MKDGGIEDSKGGIVTDILEEFINKDLFVAGEGELSGQDGLKVLKHLVQLSDRRLEDRQEVGQAEMGHLVHVWVNIDLERSHSESHIGG